MESTQMFISILLMASLMLNVNTFLVHIVMGLMNQATNARHTRQNVLVLSLGYAVVMAQLFVLGAACIH
jgi:hypothetical protein